MGTEVCDMIAEVSLPKDDKCKHWGETVYGWRGCKTSMQHPETRDYVDTYKKCGGDPSKCPTIREALE